MKELIDVFRMKEITPEARIKVIEKLGAAINDQYAMNITEPLELELTKLLNAEIKERDYCFCGEKKVNGTCPDQECIPY